MIAMPTVSEVSEVFDSYVIDEQKKLKKKSDARLIQKSLAWLIKHSVSGMPPFTCVKGTALWAELSRRGEKKP